ncbi:hypothetical protein AALB39_02830 [Lachnospiraceae bacterium 54-53]
MENDNNVSYQEAHYSASDPNKSVMTMGEWIVTLIVLMVPCVNVIMMFVWAFGNGNENRKNFCRANLIMTAIGAVLVIILYVTVFASIIAAGGYY